MISCDECKYWNDDDNCGAFECYGIDCEPLPCETNEGDCKKGS